MSVLDILGFSVQADVNSGGGTEIFVVEGFKVQYNTSSQ